MDNLYQQAADFHLVFDDRQPKQPTALNQSDMVDRVGFILEELTEFATVGHREPEAIEATFDAIESRLMMAKKKLLQKQPSEFAPIVQQADALGDLTYLVFGAYVLMDVDPTAILPIIHAANMNKRFPDGQTHRDPVTHKVLKPDTWAENYAPEPRIAAEILRQMEARDAN